MDEKLSNIDSPVTDFNQVLFTSQLVTIGRFHATPEHPRFNNSGVIEQPVMAFPRTSVEISHVHGPQFQANEKLVTFYNCEQDYRRQALDSRGDICDWFEFAPSVLLSAMAPYHPMDCLDARKPFDFAHLFSPKESFLRQRLLLAYLIRQLKSNQILDSGWIDEQAMLVLSESLTAAGMGQGSKVNARHKALTAKVVDYINTHFKENEPLGTLAKAVGASPYHLCRIFKNLTGQSIHQYKNELRLRKSLDYLHQIKKMPHLPQQQNLANLALELGYNSHSHFTSAFSRYFGMPPNKINL